MPPTLYKDLRRDGSGGSGGLHDRYDDSRRRVRAWGGCPAQHLDSPIQRQEAQKRGFGSSGTSGLLLQFHGGASTWGWTSVCMCVRMGMEILGYPPPSRVLVNPPPCIKKGRGPAPLQAWDQPSGIPQPTWAPDLELGGLLETVLTRARFMVSAGWTVPLPLPDLPTGE